jgi:DNA primase
MAARVRALFAPPAAAQRAFVPARGAGHGRARPGERFRNPRLPAFLPGEGVPTRQLAASSILRGFRTALPSREALILAAVLNHPWLLDHHAEDLADLEFRHADADRLRRAILDAAAGHSHALLEAAVLREAIVANGLGPVLAKVEAAITHASDWPARAEAAEHDVSAWWNHVITLHRKQRTLHRELKDAERALGADPNDENLQWLRDVQERLSALDGAEASLDDFGTLSGRPLRAL